jgi:hypothetical protein
VLAFVEGPSDVNVKAMNVMENVTEHTPEARLEAAA